MRNGFADEDDFWKFSNALAATALSGHRLPQAQTYEITTHATPNDPLLPQQWHLTGANGINVSKVWDDYQGDGITIGFIDDGIQYTHPDLDDRYNSAIDYDSGTTGAGSTDGAPKVTADKHGTTTSGVAAGVGNNGLGVTGVAYEANLTSFRINFSGNLTDSQLGTLLNKQLQVDVGNNSWGFGGIFADNFQQAAWVNTKAAFENVAANGRGGLGTNVVFAAGNGREQGDDVNHHSLQNSKYVIAVAATDEAGKYTYFSTPGAAVLVSAPGWNISSTDRTGTAGYINGDYVGGLAGTSYSAPVVSGLVALMLDANPNLGYRDVQEILAYSSRNSDPGNAGWVFNGAGNWNGGGLHFNNNYGFGLVDAHAAVRLAETWGLQSTVANMESASSGLLGVNSTIPDNNVNGISRSFTFSGTDITIDHIEIDLNVAHTWIGDLRVYLTSPDGTTSLLLNRPGRNPDASSGFGSSQDNINFTLQSNAFWGEQADGTWTIKIVDTDSSYVGSFTNWTIRAYGDNGIAGNNDTYIYTNEFSNVANAARTTLTDIFGSNDTLNAAAVTSDTMLDLTPGATSSIDAVSLLIAATTVIENAFLGDGNDTATGNDTNNYIDGGRGVDTVIYLGSFLDYLITVVNTWMVTVQDLVPENGNSGTDSIAGFEKFLFNGVTYLFNGTALVEDVPPPNNPPVAVDDTTSTQMDIPVTVNVLSNDTDSEGDTLDVTVVTVAAAHGNAVVNADNTITYTPNVGYVGGDSFTYEINDGHGHTDTAVVTLDVTAPPPNQAPNATNDAASTTQDQAVNINVLANDTDPETDTLDVTVVTVAAAHGNAVVNANNTITYTPNAGYVGGDTFTYEINDGHGNTDTAVVNVTINAAAGQTLNGTSAANTLNGGAGNDTINGNGGNDTLYGNGGNDVINGGSGNDTMVGGAGNDTMTATSGADKFIGGAGADIINCYSFGRDTIVFESLGDAGDVINGFKRNQDVLDLRAIFDSIGYTGSNPISAGYMQITVTSGDMTISIDADGAGAGGWTALCTLDNVSFTTLTAGTDYLVQ